MAGQPSSAPFSRPCSRCGSPDLRRVDSVLTEPGVGDPAFLALAWSWSGEPKGRFRAEICRACGHAELFLADPADLDQL